eukprot:g9155.t1
MSLRLFRARRAWPSAQIAVNGTKRCRVQFAPASSAASDRYESAYSRASSVSAAAVAALACLSAWDDASAWNREKIVWVDAHGKKVAVHEKEPQQPSVKAGQPEATPERYFPYLILGYGVAGKAALAALLERDPLAKVLVVDARNDAGQMVPPDVLAAADKDRSGGGGGDGFYSAWRSKKAAATGSGVEFARGARATALNADLGLVTLSLPPQIPGGPAVGGGAAAPATRAQPTAWAEGRHEGIVSAAPAVTPTIDGSVREAAAVAEESPAPPTRKEEVIGFGRCLLALGSRPRPPPPGFIEPAARARVALLGARDGGADREQLRKEVAAGGSVTIVGSSWQALELACWLQQEGRGDAAAAVGSGPGGAGTCRMVFSDYAPLDHILPRYLSVALLRRLNRRNIKTVGHSSLRWVGIASQGSFTPPPPEARFDAESGVAGGEGVGSGEHRDGDKFDGEDVAALRTGQVVLPPPASSSSHGLPGATAGSAAAAVEGGESASRGQAGQRRGRRPHRLHVMTAHSFDHLDTATHSTDRIVLAGVDVAPLDVNLDLSGGERGGAGDRFGRRAGALEVDRRRGAVVVNAELAASSRVWVAGDAACFPSQAHGGRRLVIRSADHAHHSGRVAGENMAAAAAAGGGAGAARRGVRDGVGDEGGRRYRHTPAFVGEAPLAGVRVAMVGDCDAAMPTHGFWWTNSATGLSRKTTLLTGRTTRKHTSIRGGSGATARRDTSTRRSRSLPPSSSEESEGDSESEEEYDGGGVTLVSRSTVRKEFTPVFGTGVVFYTSGAEVKGAMLWGFPGEATAAAAALTKNGLSTASPAAGGAGEEESAADAAAGISARALDLLRTIMERSANMDADLSNERVMQAWVQGLSDAARVVAQEAGVGHLQPMRRSVAGRVTSSTKRPPGTRDELMYQNTSKTSSAQRRLRAAYAARIRGVSPADLPDFGGNGAEAEFDPEMMGFLSYGGVENGISDGSEAAGDDK